MAIGTRSIRSTRASAPIRQLWLCAVLTLLAVAGRAQDQRAQDQRTHDQPLSFGESAVSLDGPWKFHVGDDPHWAEPGLDDSDWEAVDLTPKPGAHDGDVGLRDYVAGWAARGHRGYVGTAWYRLEVQVRDTGQSALWLAGPAAVDHVYQLYVNGRLIGGIGDFTRRPPSVVAIRPRLFELPRSLWEVRGGNLSAVIAFRVALVGGPSAANADRGGIHIAPVLGTQQGVLGRYRFQWDHKLAGYAVDALQAAAFLVLGVMALCLMPFDRRDRFYPWIAASLLLLCATRGNQPLFWLTEAETLREFLFWRLSVADALLFACWAMAWRAAFRLERRRWFAATCAVLTLIYLIARPLSSTVIVAASPTALATWIVNAVRLGFLALLIVVVVNSLRTGRGAVMPLLALLLGSIALFSQELSVLGVPGIWFPYGVGVSRTEYVLAAFQVAIFCYLLKRPRESGARVAGLAVPAALLFLASSTPGTAAPESPRIELSGCRVAGVAEELRCGSYEVYENREARSGRMLALKVIVLPARHAHPDEGPVFEIVGGPGETATDFAAAYADSDDRDRHDIVLVDERGTGDGNRLDCPPLGSDRDLQGYLKTPFDAQAARACRDRLQAHFDLRQYTTANFVADLDEVRQALGYERINIEAGSFGTYESLIYLRDHGVHVRSAFLESLVPLSTRVPLGHARAAQQALDRLFAQCREDSDCRAAYPNLPRDFALVLDRLRAAPARTWVRHPVTGERVGVELSKPIFADSVRLLMYSGAQGRELPFLIEQARAGDFNPFAQAALMSNRAIYGGVRIGLNYAITCTQSVRRILPEEIEPATRGTFLGDWRVKNQMAVCALWPETHLPAGFFDAFRSTVPAVLVSGEDDPVAPPSGALEVKSFMPNAVHVIVPGGGHTPENECTRNIRRQLFDSGSTQGLDLSCVTALEPPPFKLPATASQPHGPQI